VEAGRAPRHPGGARQPRARRERDSGCRLGGYRRPLAAAARADTAPPKPQAAPRTEVASCWYTVSVGVRDGQLLSVHMGSAGQPYAASHAAAAASTYQRQ
jgi:hypothetical protein